MQDINQINEDILGILLAGLAIAGSFIIAIVAIVATTFRKVAETKTREQSRREIAAYVAEGSITPDDAAKLLSAGESLKDLLSRKLG